MRRCGFGSAWPSRLIALRPEINHGRDDYPALLIGKAGGTLKTGRQITYQNHTPVSNLYVEMLQRMGAKIEEFGESKSSKHAAYNGRLPGLV